LDNFVSPTALGSQYLRNAAANVRRFVNGQLNMTGGMKNLITAFYRAISDDAAPPIPYREIIVTARIMDSIFAQAGAARSKCNMGSIAPAELRPPDNTCSVNV
jgi:hypothetical protein